MKKLMKVVMSMMLVTTMLFVAVPLAFAEGETNFSVILTANKTVAKLGETVEVTIGLGEFSNIGKGVNSFLGDLEYDKTKLSIGSGQVIAQNGWDMPTYENDKLLTVKGSMVTANEDIIKITFTVNDDAELGTTTITVKNAEAANYENDFLGVEGVISIEITEDLTEDEGTEDEGTGDEGAGDEGAGDEGTGDEGTGDEGTGDEGTGDEGAGDEGAGDEGTGDEGAGDEGTGDEGAGDEGTGNEGTGNEETGDNGSEDKEQATTPGTTVVVGDDKKDDTITDKEIPKAGLNTMLVFGIIAIISVAVVMYRKNQKYQDII